MQSFQSNDQNNRFQNRLMCIALMSFLSVHFSAHADQAPAEDFGRLFSKPAERADLDTKRQLPTIHKPKQKIVKKQRVVHARKPKPTLPLPAPITMQGYVKRHDGPNTVWINNKPVQENSVVNNVKIGRLTNKGAQKPSIIKSKQKLNPIDQLVINIPANGKYVKLKAGQGYNAEYNEVSEITTRARQNQVQLKSTEEDTGLIAE